MIYNKCFASDLETIESIKPQKIIVEEVIDKGYGACPLYEKQ